MSHLRAQEIYFRAAFRLDERSPASSGVSAGTFPASRAILFSERIARPRPSSAVAGRK
jgi:hypothetical protein